MKIEEAERRIIDIVKKRLSHLDMIDVANVMVKMITGKPPHNSDVEIYSDKRVVAITDNVPIIYALDAFIEMSSDSSEPDSELVSALLKVSDALMSSDIGQHVTKIGDSPKAHNAYY